jgi:LCP family protein required for cell wall assembly
VEDRPAKRAIPGRHGPGRRRPAPPSRAALPPARFLIRLAKGAVALVSSAVLLLTGYGWASFRHLHQGLSTADVIGWAAPDRATDILLVGLDSRTDAQDRPLPAEVLRQLRAGDNEGELTDTMILVRIPRDGRRAVAISLPRDLYVQLPEGYGKHKLNSAFTRAKSATAERLAAQGVDPETVRKESITAGRRLLLEAVKDLTGVGIDHYAEINLLGFALFTDAVGGVEVCLKAPVRDRFSGANFPAGPQLLSGPEALAFVRQRHGLPRGDLDRIVRQQAYLASLTNKVLSAGTLANPNRIRHLISATQQSLVLDENFDVLDFTARMQGLAAGNVVFETVPVLGDGESESDGSVLDVDPAAVRAFVAQAIDQPTQPRPQQARLVRASITVDVFNASSVAGLARRVSGQLAAQGFTPGAVGNARPRTTSVVRYPPGGHSAAREVAGVLGGLPVEEEPTLPGGTVQVVLGSDYAGPSTTRVAGASLQGMGGPAITNAPAITSAAGIPLTSGSSDTPPQPPQPPVVAGSLPCVA